MKIGLLVCDHVGPRLAGVAGDYRDMFTTLFARHAPAIRLVPFDTIAGELPPSVDACDGYVCTGSRYSAYDDKPWIRELEAFVRTVCDQEVPFVGVCFGHQVLASALGGRVAAAEHGWGAGVHRLRVRAQEAWMEPFRSECDLQFMHHDQVIQPPLGSEILGTAAHCPVAMFRAGSAMGLQPHPEFPAAYVEALVRDRAAVIGEATARRALDGVGRATDEATVTAWMGRFLDRQQR